MELEDSPKGHCPLAKGSWCGPYWTQPLLEPKPPPRGDTPCMNNCNGVGTCDYDTGTELYELPTQQAQCSRGVISNA